MSPTLLEDYAHVRSREPDSPTSNVEVLQLVEEMVRAPGSHNWAVHSSGTLSPGESEESYYLIISGSEPTEPSQRIAFLAGDDFFDIGYDPDGTVEWDEEEDFTHDGAFSGLRTLAGSDQELVDGELQPASLNLDDFGSIRVWLAEHREINDCGSPCSVGRAASITLLIEKLEQNEADNSFIYGAHVGRVLSRMDLNDEEKGIFGDAVLVGKPATPGRLGPEDPVSDPDYQSWLGQPNNAGGSVVRTGLNEWSPAYGVGWDNHLPDGSMRNVGERKRLVPYGVNGLEEEYGGDWLQVSAGYTHSLGIRKDGTLWAWGDNFYGQLGIGASGENIDTFQDPPDSNEPVQVVVPPGHPGTWKQVSAGGFHSLGIDTNGRAWAWGRNLSGQLGINDEDVIKSMPTAVFTEGDRPQAWKQLAAGNEHSLGIASDDTAWAWGANDFGQLGKGTPADITDRIPNAVLRTDGRPQTWKQLSAGDAHSLGIASDDAAWAWGDNESGQLGDGTTDPKDVPTPINTANNRPQAWKQLSAGYLHSLGIASDDAAWAWGDNFYGALGDGTVDSKNVPTPINTENNRPQAWKQLSAGYLHSLGIDNSNTAWAWGWNEYGQLGDGTSDSDNSKNAPTLVDINAGKPTTWNQLSAGAAHSLGVALNNTAWAWGFNLIGQLGIGDQNNQSVPTNIPYVYKIYNGYLHGEVGRTKYLRQLGTESLVHGVKFVTTTPESLQAWLPLGNGSNQLILWRRGDNNNEQDPDDGDDEQDPENGED